MVMALNLDCWQLIVDQLDPKIRVRTLYNCLFVSKLFFTLSVPILYSRPLQINHGEQEFSGFSKNRLANLLDLGSGFTTTTPPPPTDTIATVLKRKLLRSKSRTNTTTTNRPTKPLSTTINYYNLVMEYPNQFNIQPDTMVRCQEYLSCYAETIPVLSICIEHFDMILPLVSRFRILHTIILNVSPPTTVFQPLPTLEFLTENYLDKVLQFLRFHHQQFPGLLSKLETNSGLLDQWKELPVVQEAMGGMIDQKLVIVENRGQVKQDLSAIIVSRLKELRLGCLNNTNNEFQKMTMEFLKRCQVLETLELELENSTRWNFNLLLENSSESSQSNVDDSVGSGNGGNIETAVQAPSYRNLVGLKNLVVWGNPDVAFQVMKTFKTTLESVKLEWKEGYYSFLGIGWESSFILPKLKSLTIDKWVFKVENLSCCPNLETLVLVNAPENESVYGSQLRFWSSIQPPPFTTAIRKLELTGNAVMDFDILKLKPVIGLQELNLDTQDIGFQRCRMIQLCDEKDQWFFPNLQSVTLGGKFAIQIQGQILWLAPRLESLVLRFWTTSRSGPFDTDSFLFPPWKLDFETNLQNSDHNWPWEKAITLPIPTTLVLSSMASFPTLKTLKLFSFCTPKFQTPQAFGEMFFCPRLVLNDKKEAHYLFPNLEQIEFLWRESHDVLQRCVLQAMRKMPKLEYIRYQESPPNLTSYDKLAKWLQEVPGDRLWKEHAGYRHRPLAPLTSSRVQGNGNDRCVVEYDYPRGVRYQLNPNPTTDEKNKDKKVKSKDKKVWK